jgi:hypothetical protein
MLTLSFGYNYAVQQLSLGIPEAALKTDDIAMVGSFVPWTCSAYPA